MACKEDVFLPRFNLILLGKSGVGKSATGNTILGLKAFLSKKSSTSTTQNVKMGNAVIDGVSVDVYDTPGFFNTEISNEDVMKKCLSLLLLHDPTVFLLVMSVSRFTQEDRSAVEAAQKILGPRHSENTWILLTKGDALERDGMSVKEFIENSTHLKALVERFGNRYHVFNNITQNPSQVKELLDKIRELIKIPGGKKPPSWNIILLGKSGDGRSATANTILGCSHFPSEPAFTSVTQSTQKKMVTIRGINIHLFDTPGLYNTAISHEEVIREYRCLSLFADSVPTVFLLVLRADTPTKEDVRTVLDIEALLGDQLLQKTWILFTRGDELERQRLLVEKFVQDSHYFRQVVQRFNNRYHIFNNVAHNPDQVTQLMEKMLMFF